MAKTKINVTIDPDILAQVDSRADDGKRSGVLSRDLERYYESIRDARARLRDTLNAKEISALMDNLNGVWMSDAPALNVKMIWANVDDGCRLDGLDKKWKIDGAALVNKLRAMSMIELCAIADAAERFWNRVSAGEEVEARDALKD